MRNVRESRARISQVNILKRHIIEHKEIYIVLLFLFIIGFVIGSINAAFVGEEIKTESQNYILEFVESLKTQEIDNDILFRESISANSKPIIYIMFFGLIFIGIPFIFIYIGLYSYSIGFTITSILNSLGTEKGIAFIITLMIPQELILIPTILVIAVNAILFSRMMMNINIRSINIKTELLKYLIIFVIGIIIIVGISLFETYVGSNLIKFVVKSMI